MQYSISNFPHQNRSSDGFEPHRRKKKHSGGMAELDEEAMGQWPTICHQSTQLLIIIVLFHVNMPNPFEFLGKSQYLDLFSILTTRVVGGHKLISFNLTIKILFEKPYSST